MHVTASLIEVLSPPRASDIATCCARAQEHHRRRNASSRPDGWTRTIDRQIVRLLLCPLSDIGLDLYDGPPEAFAFGRTGCLAQVHHLFGHAVY